MVPGARGLARCGAGVVSAPMPQSHAWAGRFGALAFARRASGRAYRETSPFLEDHDRPATSSTVTHQQLRVPLTPRHFGHPSRTRGGRDTSHRTVHGAPVLDTGRLETRSWTTRLHPCTQRRPYRPRTRRRDEEVHAALGEINGVNGDNGRQRVEKVGPPTPTPPLSTLKTYLSRSEVRN